MAHHSHGIGHAHPRKDGARDEGLDAPPGDHERNCSSKAGQEQALGHQLSNETTAPGANRQPDAESRLRAAPRASMRLAMFEQAIGRTINVAPSTPAMTGPKFRRAPNVDPGDTRRRALSVCRDRLPSGRGAMAASSARASSIVRPEASRPETSSHRRPPAPNRSTFSSAATRGCIRNAEPGVRRRPPEPGEFGNRHTGDRDSHASKLDGAAHDGCAAAKATLPERVAQHDGRLGRIQRVLLREKRSAHCHPRTEGRQVVVGHKRRHEAPRGLASGRRAHQHGCNRPAPSAPRCCVRRLGSVCIPRTTASGLPGRPNRG